MGELENRRAARDMWISRGHLKAALVGAFLLSSISFGTGYLLGNGRTETAVTRPAEFAAQVPGEDLVALLARVETNLAPNGGVEALTFPDALAGASANVGPMVVESEVPEVEVTYVGSDEQVDVEAPPAGAYTLRVAAVSDEATAHALMASLAAVEGLNPWVGAEIEAGELHYTVSLGAFASENAAIEALAEVVVLEDYRDAAVSVMSQGD